MVSIDKQIRFWAEGARDDWDTAEILGEAGKTRQCLFFAHLALEKALKAHVCRATQALAPRIHNLVRLANLAQLTPGRAYLEVLARMNPFNLEGRYPELMPVAPDPDTTKARLEEAGEVLEWLMERL